MARGVRPQHVFNRKASRADHSRDLRGTQAEGHRLDRSRSRSSSHSARAHRHAFLRDLQRDAGRGHRRQVSCRSTSIFGAADDVPSTSPPPVTSSSWRSWGAKELGSRTHQAEAAKDRMDAAQNLGTTARTTSRDLPATARASWPRTGGRSTTGTGRARQDARRRWRPCRLARQQWGAAYVAQAQGAPP